MAGLLLGACSFCAMIADARSFTANQVSRAEILAAIEGFREEYKTERITEALDEIQDYNSDILYVAGDLHIEGDLDLGAEGAFLLIVNGTLRVDGAYTDQDDPETYLLVTGDMHARDVVTAGWLEVHGDLHTGRLIGDYNDCSAHIGGDVLADLFYGEEHFFTIEGELEADVVVGRPRLMIDDEPDGIDLDDPRLLEHFDRKLLRILEDTADDGTPIIEVDGIENFREVKSRVMQGVPLKTPQVVPSTSRS
ncbi:hypothetical protein DFR71_2351 [Nocardia alba]|uniref:Polymer-forming protein n=2 Tax=Nocardia alba TaxID=225051 RepID=A0A4R1FS03_9NOCA|nr:hypothetical protein DFR71_2351 [Nocardia alba]